MIRQFYEDLSDLFKRSRFVFCTVAFLFLMLIFCFWKLQVLDHKQYWTRAEENRTRELFISAQRGLILDRENNILATNIASFKAMFIRENCTDIDQSLERIAKVLGLERSELDLRVEKYKMLPSFRPIIVKEKLTDKEIARIEARHLEMPELIIQAEPQRYYPQGSFAAHVLGYMQEASLEDIQSGIYPDRRVGDMLGKTGLERVYEADLVGTEGQIIEVVENVGRSIREIASRPPAAGKDLMLSLDSDLQRTAESLLEGREGAVVVLDPRDGSLLAMASYPTFDPNKFITRFTPQEWQDLISNPSFPLENRALRGLYSPGSLFKMTMGLAGLDMGIVSEWTTFICNGETIIYNHPFACWYAPGHGALNLAGALQQSCNIYFYNLGRRIGIDDIARYAKKLGFGEMTGVDLTGEKAGLVPSREWKKNTRNLPWYPGETISVSIGQGPLNVTPLQMACHTAMLANRGRSVTPHFLTGVDGIQPRQTDIPSLLFEKVIEGMWRCVNREGTARLVKVDGLNICGKTGSTQVIGRETREKLGETNRVTRTHSWFTGFYPRTDPRLVVTIIVEHGGMGGETAAPLARRLFTLHSDKYD
jgi:penicillin-binding protein 2